MPEHAMRRPGQGILLVLIAVALFSCLDAISKHLAASYPIPMLVWGRYMVQFLLMVVFLAPSRRASLLATRRLPAQVSRALLLLSVTSCFIAALRTLPMAEMTALAFTSPLMAALLAGPWLGEKLDRRRWISLGTGFIGVLIIARPGGSIAGPGLAFALAGAACYAAYQVMTRQLSTTENSVTLLFYTVLVGSIGTTLGLPWLDIGTLPTGVDLALVIGMGVLGCMAHFLLIRAFHHAPVGTIGPFLYAQLISAVIVGWLVFGQLPDHTSLVGMAIIVLSGLAVALHRKPAAKAIRS